MPTGPRVYQQPPPAYGWGTPGIYFQPPQFGQPLTYSPFGMDPTGVFDPNRVMGGNPQGGPYDMGNVPFPQYPFPGYPTTSPQYNPTLGTAGMLPGMGPGMQSLAMGGDPVAQFMLNNRQDDYQALLEEGMRQSVPAGTDLGPLGVGEGAPPTLQDYMDMHSIRPESIQAQLDWEAAQGALPAPPAVPGGGGGQAGGAGGTGSGAGRGGRGGSGGNGAAAGAAPGAPPAEDFAAKFDNLRRLKPGGILEIPGWVQRLLDSPEYANVGPALLRLFQMMGFQNLGDVGLQGFMVDWRVPDAFNFTGDVAAYLNGLDPDTQDILNMMLRRWTGVEVGDLAKPEPAPPANFEPPQSGEQVPGEGITQPPLLPLTEGG